MACCFGINGPLILLSIVGCFCDASLSAFVSTQFQFTAYSAGVTQRWKPPPCTNVHTPTCRIQSRYGESVQSLYAVRGKDSSSGQKEKETTDTKPSSVEQQQQNQQNPDAGNANEGKKTLYELLQVPPNATREQIKQSYIKMAKLTHPDATRSGPSAGSDTVTVEFSDIASAYKLLSDPKKRKQYDRSLVAESVKREIEKAASEVGSVAGPQILAMLRRTTATTNAVITSALKDLQQQQSAASPTEGSNVTKVVEDDSESSKSSLDFAKVLNSAIKAGQDASRAIDRLELIEKSRDLEKRARQELIQSNVLRSKAAEVAEQRLLVTLSTPNSAMTASDANKILARLNTTEQAVSIFDSVLAKRSLQDHVQRLEELEREYNGRMNEMNAIELDFRNAKADCERSTKNLGAAYEAEQKAREALEKAQKELALSKQQLAELKKNVTAIDVNRKRITKEAEGMAVELVRHQERVRTALRKKCEEDPSFERRISVSNITTRDSELVDALSAALGHDDYSAESSLKVLDELKTKEDELITESLRLEDLASRLKSRAEKLRRNAGYPIAEVL